MMMHRLNICFFILASHGVIVTISSCWLRLNKWYGALILPLHTQHTVSDLDSTKYGTYTVSRDSSTPSSSALEISLQSTAINLNT